MSLTETIKKVTKAGKNAAIVEFGNGFGVAYEKNQEMVERVAMDENGFVAGKEQVEANTLSYRILGPSIDCGIDRSFGPNMQGDFSESFERQLQKRWTAGQKKHDELEKTIEACYDSITEPLQIEQYAHRQWKEMALNVAAFAGLTAIWPIAAPTAMLAGYFMNPSQAGNSLGMAVILAPFALPQVIYHSIADIINPKKTAYRIRNKKALSPKGEDDCAALTFRYDESATLKRFDSYSVVLPDGLSLYDGKKTERRGNTRYGGKGRQVYAHKERFNDFKTAKWFFRIDQDVKAQLYRAVDERDALVEKFHKFEHGMTRDDHYAVLRTAGLLDRK